MTTPSKASQRMVPADQPEATSPSLRCFCGGAHLSGTCMSVDGREALRNMEDVAARIRDGARAAAPTDPATPRVGAGTSGGATGPQIGAGGLGDAIRAHADTYGVATGPLRHLADRADALERGGRELGRILDRELTAVLDLSGAHHLIDEDGDGDWGAVWDILGELVAKGKRADALERERDAAVRDFQNVGQANLLLAARLAAVRTLAVAWGMDANDFADDGKRYNLARDHVEALHRVLDGGTQ